MSELEYWKGLHKRQVEFTGQKMDDNKELRKRIVYLEEQLEEMDKTCKAYLKSKAHV